MIEAVNSVVSNAPLVRVSADQVNAANSFAANPDRIQQAAGANLPQAPYLSPFIAWSNDYGKAVLQIRDSESGEVVTQFPSNSRLQAQLSQSIGNELAPVKTETPDIGAADTKAAPQQAAQQAHVAEAQVAAAALAKSAQASVPQIATVVTSA